MADEKFSEHWKWLKRLAEMIEYGEIERLKIQDGKPISVEGFHSKTRKEFSKGADSQGG